MSIVFLLLHLLTRDENVFAADGDDVVAAVGRRVENRFVFAHEDDSDLGGEAAEGSGLGGKVEEVPGAGVGEAGLGGKNGVRIAVADLLL